MMVAQGFLLGLAVFVAILTLGRPREGEAKFYFAGATATALLVAVTVAHFD